MEVKDVCQSFDWMVESIGNVLKEARVLLEEADSVQDFVDNKIGILYKTFLLYGAEYKRLKVTDYSALESFCRSNFSNTDMQEAMAELDQAEMEWDEFLKNIDKQLQGKSTGLDSQVNIGDKFLLDSELIDLETDVPVSTKILCDGNRKGELGPARIMVVSFGCREGATRWKKDAGCTLPILLDPDRKLYHYFGLYCSIVGSWGIAMNRHYAIQMSQDVSLPKPYADLRDDLHQMAGDFALSEDGRIILLHRSKIASDRPSMSTLKGLLAPK